MIFPGLPFRTQVNELAGSLVVNEAAEEEGVVAQPPTQEIPQEPDSTSGNSGWIIGLVLGVCALLFGGVIVYNRRIRKT